MRVSLLTSINLCWSEFPKLSDGFGLGFKAKISVVSASLGAIVDGGTNGATENAGVEKVAPSGRGGKRGSRW